MKYSYEYLIDKKNNIVSASHNFFFFAHKNEAPELTENTVIGKSLFRFIVGKETQHLYRILIDRVRKEKREVIIPFRCDGPDIRRFMELRIKKVKDDNVYFKGCLIKEEMRQRVVLLDALIPRKNNLLRMCSWCKKVDTNGIWLEVEQAIKELDLFGSDALPGITHGICEACNEMIMGEISKLSP